MIRLQPTKGCAKMRKTAPAPPRILACRAFSSVAAPSQEFVLLVDVGWHRGTEKGHGNDSGQALEIIDHGNQDVLTAVVLGPTLCKPNNNLPLPYLDLYRPPDGKSGLLQPDPFQPNPRHSP